MTDRICPGVFLLHRQAPIYSATANTQTKVEPRIGIKPTSTAYNAALTSRRRGGGRGGSRTRYFLHTKQVFGPLNFTTANWGR